MALVGTPLVAGSQGVTTAPEDPGDPSPRRRIRWWRWLLVVLLVAAVAGVAAWRLGDQGTPALTRSDVDASVQQQLKAAQERAAKAPPDAAAAYDHIAPSLVTVTTTGLVKDGKTTTGLGAGVVVNADGSILTARHVIAGGTSIEVQFADGSTSPATVADQDAANDIAVLRPARPPSVIVPATLGGGVQVGASVFAVGNPLGLTHSLSAGVVSQLDRSVQVDPSLTLKHLIQFDAAVNPGNSGGPLLDRSGNVVGVVTGLANPAKQAFFVGIGFAVPIATAGGAAHAPPK